MLDMLLDVAHISLNYRVVRLCCSVGVLCIAFPSKFQKGVTGPQGGQASQRERRAPMERHTATSKTADQRRSTQTSVKSRLVSMLSLHRAPGQLGRRVLRSEASPKLARKGAKLTLDPGVEVPDLLEKERRLTAHIVDAVQEVLERRLERHANSRP